MQPDTTPLPESEKVLSPAQHPQFSFYQKKILLLSTIVLMMVIAGMFFTYYALDELSQNNKNNDHNITIRVQALNNLLTFFGYGHGIHNFKNLLIRGHLESQRKKYLSRFKQDEENFRFSIDSYASLLSNTSSKYID
ncbi:MAG: hypothetical protein ETSY2_17445 [Candidatus Entotheonella gemina]|uniref:Chemotaxis methyl-accepting receptor HlyB-like 4HB MCP domain-containing protein n=1 Tax=Candidatus Entotheonella gemina TaxID=1429439 RepID=W4M9U1_9BACT|nr:MAG: hypothetical protein ETSY2_17445 [Candidatus Entotheonella gemina]